MRTRDLLCTATAFADPFGMSNDFEAAPPAPAAAPAAPKSAADMMLEKSLGNFTLGETAPVATPEKKPAAPSMAQLKGGISGGQMSVGNGGMTPQQMGMPQMGVQ